MMDYSKLGRLKLVYQMVYMLKYLVEFLLMTKLKFGIISRRRAMKKLGNDRMKMLRNLKIKF